jgi:hypothetical protein
MNNTLVISIVGAIILLFLVINFWPSKKQSEEKPMNNMNNDANSRLMQLQAYERLVLLANRIALPNLISRLNTSDISAKEMELLLIQTIKQKFEHNITQQIYVSTDAWKAIKYLKDQSIYTINQLAQNLPASANGSDLNKLLLEYSLTDKKANLYEVACEVISNEAKNVLN